MHLMFLFCAIQKRARYSKARHCVVHASGLLLSVEFRRHSFGLSVGLSVGNKCVFWKNGRLYRGAVCGGGSGATKEAWIRSPTVRVNFCGCWGDAM